MAVPVVLLHSNRTQQILRHMGISAVVREVGGPKRQVDPIYMWLHNRNKDKDVFVGAFV